MLKKVTSGEIIPHQTNKTNWATSSDPQSHFK